MSKTCDMSNSDTVRSKIKGNESSYVKSLRTGDADLRF